MKQAKRKYDYQLNTEVYLIVELLFCVSIKVVSMFIYKIFGFPLSICCLVYYCVYRRKRGANFLHHCLTTIIALVTMMYIIQLVYKILAPSTLLQGNLLLAILYIPWAVIHLFASYAISRDVKKK